MTNDVKAFWDEQAETHGASDLATAPDHHYRTLEIERIVSAIGRVNHETILDVGCGNGFSTIQIAKKFPEALITGIDYSESMIGEARKLRAANVEFFVGDVRSLSRHKQLAGAHYDVVLSTRCLINLASWEEQKTGILQMQQRLTPTGKLIMVENVLDGLTNLNRVRAKLGLPATEVRWHNKYLVLHDLMRFLSETQFTPDYVENIGNMYYLASRVIYAKLCKDQGVEPDYNNPINAIAAQLPTLGEAYIYSPNFMFVCGETRS
jgi:ubiquinone/menaquinone biosynthesis C-methylase UbiE